MLELHSDGVKTAASEGLRDRPEAFLFLNLSTSIVRQTVEPWLQAEIRKRRDDAADGARRRRLVGRAASGRKGSIRVRIADNAQALSEVLAALARSLRNGETG